MIIMKSVFLESSLVLCFLSFSFLGKTVVSTTTRTTTTTMTMTTPTTRGTYFPTAAFVIGSSGDTKNRNTKLFKPPTAIKSSITTTTTPSTPIIKSPNFLARPSSSSMDVVKQTKTNGQVKKEKEIVNSLLHAASQKQSIPNRFKVEQFIEELAATESTQSRRSKRSNSITPGKYRTVWSTVTSDNFVGWLLQNRPSNVLGGPSWQIIMDGKAENIVEWKLPLKKGTLQMAGLARLTPLSEEDALSPLKKKKKSNENDTKMLSSLDGYALSICGLEFRYWDSNNKKEKESTPTWTWNVFELQDDQTLGNGVGTLEILYNDGKVRITKDHIQQNTYIHVKEPLDVNLEEMFQV